MDADIMIIGAGAAGLAAAHELARHHKKVLILEARGRVGGRIHTQLLRHFEKPVECGAEFIHGNLPITISFLKQYGIAYGPVEGEMMQVEKGRFKTYHDFIAHSNCLEKILKEITQDMSVETFLNRYAAGDAELRHSVQRFVEGYDAADISKASALAFKEEWLGEDDEQYRVTGGYSQLMEALAKACREQGTSILLNEMAKEIRWGAAGVTVLTAGRRQYTAGKILVTVPLGILKSNAGEAAALSFIPPLPGKEAALQKMGYGAVIKVMLQFRENFWKTGSFKKHVEKDMQKLGFIFSDADIPTWWTQEPGREAMLTGWLGGTRAERYAKNTDEELLEKALESLAYIFSEDAGWFRERLTGWHVANWAADPFSKGAYSYATVDGQAAADVMAKPVDNVLFFAGEAFGHGASKSTVEAALSSGIEAAGQIGIN